MQKKSRFTLFSLLLFIKTVLEKKSVLQLLKKVLSSQVPVIPSGKSFYTNNHRSKKSPFL